MSIESENCQIEAEVRRLVQKHMGWDHIKVDLWMTTENPLLGGVEPLVMIRKGRGRKVIKFVEGAIFENSAPDKKST
jgi:hypothetical protein